MTLKPKKATTTTIKNTHTPVMPRSLFRNGRASDITRELKVAMGRPFDLLYSVELWDDADSHVEELIALTGDYRVARAAFDEAVKRRPGRIVMLRQKTRLLADSRRKN